MQKVKNIIVGCGLSGMVLAERLASQRHEEVLIVDRRCHIGGNVYDYKDTRTGITVHKYGPHAFHTNDEKVWEYLRQFTEFNDFQLRVRARIKNKLVPVPFNFNSMEALFSSGLCHKAEQKLTAAYGYGAKVPILELRKAKDADLVALADFVYENVFKGYTIKQWGTTPELINPSVTARVPVSVSRDDRYFQDKYQGIPVGGYTQTAEKMLANPLIKVELNTDWANIKDRIAYDRLFYTGSIDEFFNYEYGVLPYRSVYFKKRTYSKPQMQPTVLVNYPNTRKWTRICEPKLFLNEQGVSTVLMYEYSEAFELGKNERFYPIANVENDAVLCRYQKQASKLKNVYFFGRLGDYKYYNMDQCISRALEVFRTLPE